MNPQIIFWITFIAFLFVVILSDLKFGLLRDDSTAIKRPYSFARVQLTWWTIIILSAFISIICASGQIPTFDQSTLILLGISSATTATARVIDISDQSNAASVTETENLSRNQQSGGFFLDILSDKSGVSIHRFQTVAFNIVFGCWFIAQVIEKLKWVTHTNFNDVIPHIETNNLILLGLSSATYAALKSTENKQTSQNAVTPGNQDQPEEEPLG